MTFDNTTIGLLLFYTVGALILFTFALLYFGSRNSKRR